MFVYSFTTLRKFSKAINNFEKRLSTPLLFRLQQKTTYNFLINNLNTKWLTYIREMPSLCDKEGISVFTGRYSPGFIPLRKAILR
jgi:hypothetical protein